jgi:hypothetical protein
VSYDLTYISLGAGVQSSAMHALSVRKERGVPRADFAVFADTQDEPGEVYEHLERLREWSEARGMPVHTVTAGRLSDDDPTFLQIPAFTLGDDGRASMLKRQCTTHYKIAPITRFVRETLGYKPRQRVRERVRSLHGISVEEAYRMRDARDQWLTIEYPLVEAGIYRQLARRIWTDLTGLPEPPRSACVYCPFKSDEEWRHTRDTDPEGWGFACTYDERLRGATRAGDARPAYLHRSLVPLRDADLEDQDDGQLALWNAECEGACGV